MKRRMWRCVGPVLLISVLINIPKFFESYVYYNEDRQMYALGVSEMRRNPLYSMISQWVRLFLLGLIPFTIILYFNIKIYKKLRKRTLLRNTTMSTGKRGKFISDNGKVCIDDSMFQIGSFQKASSTYFWTSWVMSTLLFQFPTWIDVHFCKKSLKKPF